KFGAKREMINAVQRALDYTCAPRSRRTTGRYNRRAPYLARAQRRPPMPPNANAAPPAHSATTRAFVQWIRSAAPYIHAFRGKTFVIAFGGEVVADETFLGIIHDLNLLHSLGVQIVVVHGARPQIEAILAQQDIESRYAFGLRITDAETMDCVLEAGGQVRSRIEALP